MLTLLSAAALAATFSLADGVLVDTDGGVAFVMVPGGEVQAVGLTRGAGRWTKPGARPLALIGDRLVVHGEVDAQRRLPVQVLDARSGRQLSTCLDIQLPEWSAGVDGQLGARLDVTGAVVGDDFDVSWSTRTWYAGGAPPPPEIVEAATRSASGTTRCETGWDGPAPAAPPGPRGSLRQGEVEGRVGQVYAEVAPDGVTPGRLLHEGPTAWAGVSVDGRHAMVAFGEPPDYRYDLAIYALSSGEQLGVVRGPALGAPFIVHGGAVIASTGDRVVAVGLDGEERWSVPLRITPYRGPYPP